MILQQRDSVYDKLRPYLSAPDLIQRLGIEQIRVSGSEAYCRPLCHESSSGESLQINLQTGRWNCKACQSSGVYGDLFQLVEYVQTGGAPPSRGSSQSAAPGHRAALIWLCDQFGIPFDEDRISGDPGLDVVHLFAMAAHEHLLKSPDVLDWIREKWGFDLATVESYGLGFMPSPMLPAIKREACTAQSRGAFRSSGLGWHAPDGTWQTRFEGRVTFPYLEHGRAVYLIGRSTPWTPMLDGGVKPPKYHKLSVHSKERPYISERVTNDHLYNETVMDGVDEVGVLEGVADDVAVSALGFPVVSPVTISFNEVDLERFLRKCRERGIKRVWILFDNELSGSGNFAARRTGIQFVKGGLVVKIVTLPLGEDQKRARDEVIQTLGPEAFEKLERSNPRDRKRMMAELVKEEATRIWLAQNIEASKIDAAEWCAAAGPAAPGKLDAIIKSGKDLVRLEIEDLASKVDMEQEPAVRADVFTQLIELVAHVDDRLSREGYAGHIAKAAGKGVTKAEIARRIAGFRKSKVSPVRKEAKEGEKVAHEDIAKSLLVLPPSPVHTQPVAPVAPKNPNAPAAPPAPGGKIESEHTRYAVSRDVVARAVDGKFPEEAIGDYISQTVKRSMGFTPFRTPGELFLVRGNQRIPVGLSRISPEFSELLWLVSGLTNTKSTHRSYIAATVYFLGLDASKVSDVSWSFVGANGSVYFPQGDSAGKIVKIEPGKITRTRMAEVRVPAVAGEDFAPFEYVEESGGIADMLDAFRWTSISAGDRMVLMFWIVCLPILRRVGTVPIVRIEGGSSSGKTRTVDAVSILVNGRKSASVPTAPALISRMSVTMLTVDDNREAIDVSPSFLGTLLQATHLGAREKRKGNSDTGTVVERICGALLMNGIEPIHDGRSELVSRMLTMRCSDKLRAEDSPTADAELMATILRRRDSFWSESTRRCADALAIDAEHGERIGKEIEAAFGDTRIGRLSAYLRVMYFAWVAGLSAEARERALDKLAPDWLDAFGSISNTAMESLLAEELTVSVLRYVFAFGQQVAEPIYTGAAEHRAFSDKFVRDVERGDSYLGPIRATHLARLARTAGKEMNAPRAITTDLRAGQLERRVLDGVAFLEAAGFNVQIETTSKGKNRFTFHRESPLLAAALPKAWPEAGDTWQSP